MVATVVAALIVTRRRRWTWAIVAWLLVVGARSAHPHSAVPPSRTIDESSKRLHTNYFASPRIFAAAATSAT
ncbi:hypothetical protein GS444_23480 [Rhodococcus hoagii]|nr:hypothetical protein [Prescottella equi]